VHVVLPWHWVLLEHTFMHTLNVSVTPIHASAHDPLAMSPLVVLGLQPQSECIEHSRVQTPASGQ
jgi:hypothetical protein